MTIRIAAVPRRPDAAALRLAVGLGVNLAGAGVLLAELARHVATRL